MWSGLIVSSISSYPKKLFDPSGVTFHLWTCVLICTGAWTQWLKTSIFRSDSMTCGLQGSREAPEKQELEERIVAVRLESWEIRAHYEEKWTTFIKRNKAKGGYQTSEIWTRGQGNSVPAAFQGPKPLTTVMVSLVALPSPQLTYHTLNCACSYSHQPLD